MIGFARDTARFSFQPPRGKKGAARRDGARPIAERHALYAKAWRGVSKAFARTGNHMWDAVARAGSMERRSPGVVRFVAADRNIADALKNVSVMYAPNGKLRVVAKNNQDAVLLRGVSFEVKPNGEIHAVRKSGER